MGNGGVERRLSVVLCARSGPPCQRAVPSYNSSFSDRTLHVGARCDPSRLEKTMLDLDGFFMSTEFFTQLASIITAVFTALFGELIANAFATPM